MHIIKPYVPSVTLFTNEGDIRAFKSHTAARKALGLRWIAANVGEHFNVFTGWEHRWSEEGTKRTPCYRQSYAIMRSDLGEVVTWSDLEGPKPPFTPWWLRRYMGWKGVGPVPGTGRRRGGHHHRKVSTTQERRQAEQVDSDEPAPRAARKGRNLPNARDDYGIASRRDISWKNHRRTQWKPSKA